MPLVYGVASLSGQASSISWHQNALCVCHLNMPQRWSRTINPLASSRFTTLDFSTLDSASESLERSKGLGPYWKSEHTKYRCNSKTVKPLGVWNITEWPSARPRYTGKTLDRRIN